MEGWCTRPSPWCAVLHKHTQIHDNPLHRLSKAMNGGHSAYSPCKSGSQRDSVAAVIKESPLFRCLSTFQSFPTRLRHTRWTTSQQIWRQFEIFCMKSCKLQTTNYKLQRASNETLGCRSQWIWFELLIHVNWAFEIFVSVTKLSQQLQLQLSCNSIKALGTSGNSGAQEIVRQGFKLGHNCMGGRKLGHNCKC